MDIGFYIGTYYSPYIGSLAQIGARILTNSILIGAVIQWRALHLDAGVPDSGLIRDG